jgi:hypothetical protein
MPLIDVERQSIKHESFKIMIFLSLSIYMEKNLLYLIKVSKSFNLNPPLIFSRLNGWKLNKKKA